MQHLTEELKGEVSIHGFFDFGKDAFATLEIELDGEFAENTEIILGEVAHDGTIVHQPGFTTFLQHIFKLQNGHHTYRFPIQTHIPAYDGFPHCSAPKEADGEIAPFRYVEVNRYYGKVTLRRTCWFGDWNDNASYFHCDNDALNNVWDFCKYSIKATTPFGLYIDGERERMPYEADAYINQLGHFCCDANYTIARDTIQHFMENGRFTWPTEWFLFTPLLVRDYLLYSGDKEQVLKWLPSLDEKLLPQFMLQNGLLAPAKFLGPNNSTIWDDNHQVVRREILDIIDWPETERDGYEQGDVNFVPNALLYSAMLAMYEITENPSYKARAENLRQAIRTHFWKGDFFVDSLNSTHTGIHTAMFALFCGLLDGDDAKRHAKLMASRGMACSVYGAQFLLDACYNQGLAQHALDLMTSDGQRSWLNMLREGSTITMESWGGQWKQNQDWNHPWGAAPANIIPRKLCGIRPIKPGFKTFEVQPQPGTLGEFTAIQPTPNGPIHLHFNKDNGYELRVPDNTCAIWNNQTLNPGTHHLV